MTRKFHRAFTLIELLVVVSIIVLLLAILLPSLGAAREQSKRVKCLAQMHGVGTAVQLFAHQLQNRVPCQRNNIPNAGPWMCTMNAADFFFMQDECGLDPKLFIDPSNAKSPPNANEATFTYGYSGGGGGYYWPNLTDTLTRTWSNTDYTQDSNDPRWTSGSGRCNFVMFPFQWYGVAKYGAEASKPINQNPWEVYRNTETNKGGTSGGVVCPAAYNPPIMSDYAMHSTSEDRYNHGNSFSKAYTNVLFQDGSATTKQIDSTPFAVMYGAYYFYR